MSKFVKNIVAGSATLSNRAAQMGKQAEVSSKALILKIQGEVERLEMEKVQLTDFAPETTDSLRPSVKGGTWDAQAWITKIHAIDVKLYNLKLELKLAQQLYDEWFGADSDAETTDVATVE